MNRRQGLQGAAAAAGIWPAGNRLEAQSSGSVLYLDPERGADANPGTKEQPLRTLSAAARRVNADTGAGAVTVMLAAGVYAVGEPALFKPARRSFTRNARLTIRAEVLPDDPAWTTQSMPVLIHTMSLSAEWMGRPDPFGGVAYGMQFETSHVTVQGLRILGTPHIEAPSPKAIHRVYPIAREGAGLDDLEVKQCVFAGNRETVEVHCGVLARGSGVVVDHCVFHGCKITAVYWTRGAKGCAMRNTLVTGAYVTGAWICETAGDFEYRNNVVSGCLSAVLFQGPAGKYKLENSLFAGNQHLYGAGLGPAVNFKALPPSTLDLAPSSRVSAKPVEIELDQSKRNYLHVVAGTPGAEIPAGLFARA
jgi:hypothetical protein